MPNDIDEGLHLYRCNVYGRITVSYDLSHRSLVVCHRLREITDWNEGEVVQAGVQLRPDVFDDVPGYAGHHDLVDFVLLILTSTSR
jgi:hypothetical protein